MMKNQIVVENLACHSMCGHPFVTTPEDNAAAHVEPSYVCAITLCSYITSSLRMGCTQLIVSVTHMYCNQTVF